MATQRIGGRAEKEPEPRRQDRPFLLVDRATWLVLPDELHGRGNWRDHASLFQQASNCYSSKSWSCGDVLSFTESTGWTGTGHALPYPPVFH